MACFNKIYNYTPSIAFVMSDEFLLLQLYYYVFSIYISINFFGLID